MAIYVPPTHSQTISAELVRPATRSPPLQRVPNLPRQPDENMVQWSLASSHQGFGGGAAAVGGSGGGPRGGLGAGGGGGGKSTGSRGSRLFNRSGRWSFSFSAAQRLWVTSCLPRRFVLVLVASAVFLFLM